MNRIKIILLVIFLCPLLQAQDKIYFVIRVDDIQSRNTTTTPRRITDFESMLGKHQALVTWAVIPHRLIESQNKDGILTSDLIASAARGHEIALHGYNHICPTCSQSSHEMICTTQGLSHSREIQSGLISDGLAILSDSLGLTPTAFVPPGHHADTTSYSVLVENKFPWISTTGYSASSIYPGLHNLPPHNEYTWYLSNDNYQARLQDAMRDIREKAARDGYFCLLLHDPFIRMGYENGLVINWVDALLDSVETEFGESLVFSTLSQAAEEIFGPATGIEAAKELHLPDQISMSTYPNPFNNQVNFTYSIQHAGNVRISIFDILGREVSTLTDRWHDAGEYNLYWSSTGLGSGNYFYHIWYTGTTNDVQKSGRLILLK